MASDDSLRRMSAENVADWSAGTSYRAADGSPLPREPWPGPKDDDIVAVRLPRLVMRQAAELFHTLAFAKSFSGDQDGARDARIAAAMCEQAAKSAPEAFSTD